MFLQYYGLSEQPFGVTPDPAYLYPSGTHCKSLTALTNGILASRGFLALIAEPGMGKTTLLYELLDELRDSARTVFLFQTQCDSREFFCYLLAELGVDPQGMDLVAMHSKLNEVLFDEMLKGKRFVLIVDEAQNLDESVLETVRLLSNFETQHTKLLQIILAGQPELARKLANPRLSQLRQRIAVVSRLEPLTLADTTAYIEHRLKVAGYRGQPLFTPEAMAAIAEKSRGIPRSINNICFDALAKGQAEGKRTITGQMVRDVLAQLDLSPVIAEMQAPQVAVVPETKEPSDTSDRLAAPNDIFQAASITAKKEDLRGDGPASSPESILPGSAMPTTDENVQQLSYKPVTKFKLARWTLRGIVVVAALMSGSLLLFPVLRGHANVVSGPEASAAVPAPKPQPTFAADPQTVVSGQLLTVVAGPNQTLQEISLLYLGKYDANLAAKITALNPELKNGQQIQAGQLIRLPLPPGTLFKVSDSSYAERESQLGRPAVPQPTNSPAGSSASSNQVAVESKSTNQ